MSVIFRPARPLLGLAIVLALAGCAASAARPTAVEANVTTKAVGYLDAVSYTHLTLPTILLV